MRFLITPETEPTYLAERSTKLAWFAKTALTATVAVLSSLWGTAVVPLHAQTETELAVDVSGYNQYASKFFETYCLDCHRGESAEGDFRIDSGLPPHFAQRAVAGRWREVINVLQGHEMPPKDHPQPTAPEVAGLIDWATDQMVRVELHERKQHVTLRRLNRNEYRNTIADLVGVDFDISHFPQDPPASGFDNIGRALGSSPLQVELYLAAAESITNRMFVTGEQPATIKWRFEPESGDSDSNRVRYDKFNVIVNGGKNSVDGVGRVMHHDSWDRKLNARGFQVPTAGDYVIRVRAASRVPTRDEVVRFATKSIQARYEAEIEKSPNRRPHIERQMQQDIHHFETSRHYDYGPGRLKINVHLGGQPLTVAEFDVDQPFSAQESAPADASQQRSRDPIVFEFPVRMTTEDAGITLNYTYQIAKELENFTIQGKDDFPRPEVWVDWFEIEGPIYSAWPPETHTRWLPGKIPADAPSQRALAQQVLRRFLPRALRRPVSGGELDAFMNLYDTASEIATGSDLQASLNDFIDRLKVPLITALVSPHFLFLAEPTGPDSSAQLTGYELASRLSYFLWSSMPDDELLRVAASGNLADHNERRRQVDRMLKDPKAKQLSENFASQWLGIREIGSNPPAADLFRDYDPHVEKSMVRQTIAFFEDALQHDRDIMTLLQSDHELLNERLTRYYDLPRVHGDHFRRVPLEPGSNRGGLLTHASILTVTSNGTRTSPVKRGTWILKTLLASDPGLPVANVGEIAPKVPGIDKATVRQRLEIHRELPQCARCHQKIDPLGFALENYDAAGRWREREGFGYQGRVGENDPIIDASAVMPDGAAINGVAGLRQAVLDRKDLFLKCVSEKLFTYALGRELGYVDQPMIQESIDRLNADPSQRTLRNLIYQIVTSDTFEMR